MKKNESNFSALTFSVRPRNSHIGIAEPEHIDNSVVKTAIE